MRSCGGSARPLHVDLDVVEQLIPLHMTRFKFSMAQYFRDEVLTQRRTANAQQVQLALFRLVSVGLIERAPDPDSSLENDDPPSGRRYRLTRQGKRLRRIIPTPRRSAILTNL